MKITYTARKVNLRDNFKERCEKKLSKFNRIFSEDASVNVVVTQNIDGLHQAAGSKQVYELHGSVLRNTCMRCGKFYEVKAIQESDGIPRCVCGGIIKPDVVLYEEGLDQRTMEGAARAIANADLFIVGGTSLAVYPAAGLVRYYAGNRLVLINRDQTPLDGSADLVLHGRIGEILGQV